MARSDRLMRLMDRLRRLPAPVTAARLASETGVSPRQLYRDIATLRAGGALIDGEAGVGYTLTEDPALPPQSFSRLEIEALRLAVEALPAIGDPDLIEAAHTALSRMIATLPERQAQQAMHAIMKTFVPLPARDPPQVPLALIRQACWDEQALMIDYCDVQGARTQRVIWPLALSYSERALMLLAHCRLRDDFRTFHVNRIADTHMTGDSFRPRRVALLRDYIITRRDMKKPGRADGGPGPVSCNQPGQN
ncbi:MAG: YafY family protein [Paracoccus sp. (in: a-proteobacteria)]|uniref:helix-turn-helix transcriptional regulator n=1 Tax=Paracoccus sp. TaxID=267 RepID=UPI0026E07B21|nr:YafY family protein [Paracoccus sp. (in: a-proteobacteria)]MDO5631678.1 YafY family protein [Paracoccus sp. (in: a-proteobacteria)]